MQISKDAKRGTLMFENLKENLTGCIYTIFTPFNEKRDIDYEGLEKYLSTLYQQGARKFYAMAYNSRYSQLSDSEILELNSFCITFLKKLDKNNIVIVGDPIHCSTKTSKEFTRQAQDEGADMISLIFREKYFNDDQVLSHYDEVASVSKIPLLVHEMPFLSGFDGTQMHWPPSLLEGLLKIDKISALKEDAKDRDTTIKALNLEPKIRIIIAGRKSYVRQFWKHGARAYLNGISMIDARIGLKFEEALNTNDEKLQDQIISKLESKFFDNSVKQFGWHRTNKALLETAGFFKRYERLPLTELTEKEMEAVNADYFRIKEALKEFNL